MNLGVLFDGVYQAGTGFNGWLKVRIQRRNLARNIRLRNGSFDGSAVGVTHDEENFYSQYGGSILERTDDLGVDDIPGDAADEYVTDGLVEDELHRHARISAGEYGGKRLLLLDGVLPEHL